MYKRLTKGNDEIFFGVCSGIGEYFDIDPIFVRIFFLILTFVNGIGILPYIVLALLIPNKS